MTPNQRWSLDFVSDQLTDGRRFRVLTVVDDCTRECLALVADTSLSGARVARELADADRCARQPGIVVSDNGTEFTSNAILRFATIARSTGTTSRRQADPERLHRELQWSAARRAAERDAVPVAEPCPRHARSLAHRLQHRTTAFPARLADASRVRRDLHPATGPGAAQPAKLRASPRRSTRPNRPNSNAESRSRWIKVGGNVKDKLGIPQGKESPQAYPELENRGS